SDRPVKVKDMLDKLGKDGLAKLIRHTKEMAKTNDAIAALADKDLAQVKKQLQAIQEGDTAKNNPLTPLFVPGPQYFHVWERAAGGKAGLALLEAAIAVQGGKEDDLKSHPDPYGKGPFAYKKVAGGFELTSALKIKDKAVSLRVGKGE